RRLAHEGLASVVGSGGRTEFAAAAVTRADLVELFGIIGALEGLAGRGAAALTRAARGALAAELDARNREFARRARSPRADPGQFFAAHDAFHAALVAGLAGARLRTLIEAVRPQIKRYELFYAHAVGHDFRASVREHRAITAAVRTGRAEAVERAIRRNWSRSADRLLTGSPPGALAALGDYRSLA